MMVCTLANQCQVHAAAIRALILENGSNFALALWSVVWMAHLLMSYCYTAMEIHPI